MECYAKPLEINLLIRKNKSRIRKLDLNWKVYPTEQPLDWYLDMVLINNIIATLQNKT
jgi:hypothetical protein